MCNADAFVPGHVMPSIRDVVGAVADVFGAPRTASAIDAAGGYLRSPDGVEVGRRDVGRVVVRPDDMVLIPRRAIKR